MRAGKKQRLMAEIDAKGNFFVQGAIADDVYSLRISALGSTDFIINPIILKPGHRTQVFDPLQMKRCPKGIRCTPNTTVPLPTVCL